MNWSVDDLKKTKVGQMPANQGALAKVQKHDTPINPMGGLLPAQSEQNPLPALEQKSKKRSRGKKRVACCITLIRFGMRSLDSDNLIAAHKGLRDAVCASLSLQDNDGRIIWQYSQVETKGQTGCLVIIEVKPS